jgi:hypothetical protein
VQAWVRIALRQTGRKEAEVCVCDSEEFVKPLRRFQACRCKEHAHLNDVNWNETGKYNKSLALALCNAAYACARAGGVH